MDYGSLGCGVFSAGLADWTETPCRPRGEPEWTGKHKADGNSPTVGRPGQQQGLHWDDMEPGRWPHSGGMPQIIKGFTVAIWSGLKPRTTNSRRSKMLCFPLVWKSICSSWRWLFSFAAPILCEVITGKKSGSHTVLVHTHIRTSRMKCC